MTAKPLPPLELLDEWLNYDPETGIFTWRKPSGCGGRIPAGTVAGTVNADGYIYLSVGGRRPLAHRLAFKMHYRREPGPEVDHRDGDPTNNRIGNLREATDAENSRNSKLQSRNTSGVKGVFWDKRRSRWMVGLRSNGKQIHVGCFKTIEDAASAIRIARERIHGEFARHN